MPVLDRPFDPKGSWPGRHRRAPEEGAKLEVEGESSKPQVEQAFSDRRQLPESFKGEGAAKSGRGGGNFVSTRRPLGEGNFDRLPNREARQERSCKRIGGTPPEATSAGTGKEIGGATRARSETGTHQGATPCRETRNGSR